MIKCLLDSGQANGKLKPVYQPDSKN